MNASDPQPWIGDCAAHCSTNRRRRSMRPPLSRLNRARQAALAPAPPRSRATWWLPAGRARQQRARCCLRLWSGRRSDGEPVDAAPGAHCDRSACPEADAIAGDDSLEFYQDLEFYAWLDAQEQESDG